MEEFDLVEADFQQYYQLNILDIGFSRYARLFANLPPESRILKKWAPVASWTWQDETYSRILHELKVISTTLYNTNRKKGAAPLKPEPQFQPEAVEQAKEMYKKQKHVREEREREQEAMRDFWQQRNPGMEIG